MRIKGPGDGTPPKVGEVDATEPLGEAPAAEGTAQAGGVGKTAAAAAPGEARAVDPVAEIARRLKAGEINAAEAVDALVDDAVSRQVGKATADRQDLATELKQLLRDTLRSDPYLAERVRRMERGK